MNKRHRYFDDRLQLIVTICTIICLLFAIPFFGEGNVGVIVAIAIIVFAFVVYRLWKSSTIKSKLQYIHSYDANSIIYEINRVSKHRLDDNSDTRTIVENLRQDMYDYYSNWFINPPYNEPFPHEIIDLSEEEFFYAKYLQYVLNAIQRYNHSLIESTEENEKELIEQNEYVIRYRYKLTQEGITLFSLYYGVASILLDLNSKNPRSNLLSYSVFNEKELERTDNDLNTQTTELYE